MGNHGATTPTLSPHSPLRPASPPSPLGRGDVPPPPEGAATPGGETQLSPHATGPHAPDRLLRRGPQQARGPAQAHEDGARVTPGDTTGTRT